MLSYSLAFPHEGRIQTFLWFSLFAIDLSMVKEDTDLFSSDDRKCNSEINKWLKRTQLEY